MPLYELLGGKVRSSLPCAWPLATGDAKQEIDEALGMMEARKYNIFKMKMGAIDPETDVIRACKVADELCHKASIRVDPNGKWDETTTKWAVPRLEDAGVTIIEQPMARWNLEASARVTERSNIAIMIDESVCTPEDMIKACQIKAADLVSIKLMKSGGIMPSREIAQIAMAGGVSVYMGTFLECSIGTAANMQLAVTLPHLPFGGELSGPELVSEDISLKPALYKDFELQLAEGVGIGVEIDEDKLKAFSRKRSYSVHGYKSIVN